MRQVVERTIRRHRAGGETPYKLKSAPPGMSTEYGPCAGVVVYQSSVTRRWTILSSATTALTTTAATPVKVSAALTGLKAATTYYFQFVVTTAAGTATGPIQTFTTE